MFIGGRGMAAADPKRTSTRLLALAAGPSARVGLYGCLLAAPRCPKIALYQGEARPSLRIVGNSNRRTQGPFIWQLGVAG